MIAQELVKAGCAYVGRDGEIRYVHCINRPGNGYCVQWDSLPRPADTKGVLEWFVTRHTRPNGIMQMRKFQKWAVDMVASQVASHDTQGSTPLTRCAAGRDGECGHAQCPQLRDGEPAKSGRHCPLDDTQGEKNV